MRKVFNLWRDYRAFKTRNTSQEPRHGRQQITSLQLKGKTKKQRKEIQWESEIIDENMLFHGCISRVLAEEDEDEGEEEQRR